MFGVDGLAGDDGIERGAEIFAGDGEAVAGSACVELAAIDEIESGVVEEEVGRTGGVIVAGDLL